MQPPKRLYLLGGFDIRWAVSTPPRTIGAWAFARRCMIESQKALINFYTANYSAKRKIRSGERSRQEAIARRLTIGALVL